MTNPIKKLTFPVRLVFGASMLSCLLVTGCLEPPAYYYAPEAASVTRAGVPTQTASIPAAPSSADDASRATRSAPPATMSATASATRHPTGSRKKTRASKTVNTASELRRSDALVALVR